MRYFVGARAYLARAKDCLLETRNDALFYAAFELRCCVEARQEAYLEAIEYINKKIRPWEIGKTAKTLASIFTSEKIAFVSIGFGEGKRYPMYYTPVSKRLIKGAEKLGELLHSQKAFHADEDVFWSTTRAEVLSVYRDAWLSCRGTLLAPPLWQSKTKQCTPSRWKTLMTNSAHLVERAVARKTTISMRVNYLDQVPSNWVCDL